MRSVWIAALMAVALTGCVDEEKYKREVSALKGDMGSLRTELASAQAKISKLEAENAELKITPAVLLSSLRTSIDGKNEQQAQQALSALTTKYPDSPEAATGKKLLAALISEREAREKEAARIAALGLKAIPVKPTFAGNSSSVVVQSAQIAGIWRFNDYGDEYRYRDAERGNKYVTAQVTYSSEDKDPKLLPMAVYASEGGALKRIGVMGYEFTRWESFATFLGNYHDTGNDFAHSERIRFSMGLQVPITEITKPVFIVAAKGGCAERSEDRFGNPPVRYMNYACNQLPQRLTAQDFTTGDYGVLKRFD